MGIKRAVALEGGGAKGAYHIGVLKALKVLDIKVDCITGSSIGAINGAITAQGDFLKLYNMWKNIDKLKMFDKDAEKIINIIIGNKNEEKLSIKEIINLFKEKGINTDNIYNLIEEYINIKKLYKSKIDYGLATVEYPSFKVLNLFKNDIKQENMKKYILASATFPGFKFTEIDDKLFIDGGVKDNCPVNMLIDEDKYDEIIEVRTYSIGIYKKIKNNKSNIITISPSKSLGHILSFDQKVINNSIKLGYYDTFKAFEKVYGNKYCIYKFDNNYLLYKLMNISDDTIEKISKYFTTSDINSKKILFEIIIPKLTTMLKINKKASYDEIVLDVLEYLAHKLNIDELHFYHIDKFIIEINDRIKNFVPTTKLDNVCLLLFKELV